MIKNYNYEVYTPFVLGPHSTRHTNPKLHKADWKVYLTTKLWSVISLDWTLLMLLY